MCCPQLSCLLSSYLQYHISRCDVTVGVNRSFMLEKSGCTKVALSELVLFEVFFFEIFLAYLHLCNSCKSQLISTLCLILGKFSGRNPMGID